MRYGLALGVLAAVAAAGCKRDQRPPAAEAASAEATPPAEAGLPWIHDDYPAALARARAANQPLVIDMWAAWCHTCLAMKHGVLADPGLRPLADRFVWLAL